MVPNTFLAHKIYPLEPRVFNLKVLFHSCLVYNFFLKNSPFLDSLIAQFRSFGAPMKRPLGGCVHYDDGTAMIFPPRTSITLADVQ